MSQRMPNVGGHTLDSWDKCIRCGRAWLDLKDVDESCIGAEGIACVGKLNAAEVAEIKAERERRARAIDAAFGWTTKAAALDEALEAEAQRADEPDYMYLGWCDALAVEADRMLRRAWPDASIAFLANYAQSLRGDARFDAWLGQVGKGDF